MYVQKATAPVQKGAKIQHQFRISCGFLGTEHILPEAFPDAVGNEVIIQDHVNWFTLYIER
jgi:hypothetical protein